MKKQAPNEYKIIAYVMTREGFPELHHKIGQSLTPCELEIAKNTTALEHYEKEKIAKIQLALDVKDSLERIQRVQGLSQAKPKSSRHEDP